MVAKGLITAVAEQITETWEDFEITVINKYNNDPALTKKEKKQYKYLELKTAELYDNGMYDKIYELLLLGYSGNYEHSIVSKWAKKHSYDFSRRYGVAVDPVELESLFQEHLYGLLDGVATKPMLNRLKFFENYRNHCAFIAREYACFIRRKKRVGNFRYKSLEDLEEKYGFEPADKGGISAIEQDIRCMLGKVYFTEKEEAILTAILADPKMTQREMIGTGGTSQLIQVQRVIRKLREKLGGD